MTDAVEPLEHEGRWEEVGVLARDPGAEAEARLVALMRDDDYRVRERVVAVLSRRFTPAVASACAVALADDANAGHRAAGLALLERAGSSGRAVLLGALQHPSADVRLSAASALPGAAPDLAVVASIEAAVRREADPNARAALLLALGRTGRREAIPPLLHALTEGNLWIQTHALEAVGEVGDHEVASRLLPFASSPVLGDAALRALARLAAPATAEALIRLVVAAGRPGPALLSALAATLEAAPSPLLQRLASAWPAARETLAGLLADPDASPAERTDAARLFALLDLPGAAFELVRWGPFSDGYRALRRLTRRRLGDLVAAVLQTDDPEPSLELVDSVRSTPQAAMLSVLLVHPDPGVRAAVLAALPPGSVPVSDLLEILVDDDPETALPAALALAADGSGAVPDRLSIRRRALIDRALGPDGPGRSASIAALSGIPGDDVDGALRAALGSEDPEVRAAAAAAAAASGLPEHELLLRLEDPASAVRAAVLRSLAARASRGGAVTGIDWRDCLILLVDDPNVAAAAGAAIIALGGDERVHLVDEMLAQDAPVRVGALEEIVLLGDAEAAAQAAIAVDHEDEETARAAVAAAAIAWPEVRSEALALALRDARALVRGAAAEAVALLADPGGPLREKVAEVLEHEEVPEVQEALLAGVARWGGEEVVPALTAVLGRERLVPGAEAAAEGVAQRAPAAVRGAWTVAPARAERRWARALTLARRRAPLPERGRA